MRVFLYDQKILSVIDKKEEITDETCLITEQEAEKIAETLAYNGVFWRIDKYTVGASGKAPSKVHKWDEPTKTWVLDPELEQAELNKTRANLWERIKELREEATKTGVAVEVQDGVIKHFHTDDIARREYDGMSVMVVLNTFIPRKWKTIENEFVTMDLELFKKLVIAVSNKVQHDYTNAEKLKMMIDKSKNPEIIELNQGWSKGFE